MHSKRYDNSAHLDRPPPYTLAAAIRSMLTAIALVTIGVALLILPLLFLNGCQGTGLQDAVQTIAADAAANRLRQECEHLGNPERLACIAAVETARGYCVERPTNGGAPTDAEN